MTLYIYQHKDWPNFRWEQEKLNAALATVRHRQGRLMGRMEGIGFGLQAEASLRTLTLDVLKTSEIEGEILNPEQVRSSIARRLGMDIAGMVPADRNVDGVVEMMIDATRNYKDVLSHKRLYGWHAALFPTGHSGMHKIVVGAWRDNPPSDPMVIVSGPMGKEKMHYQAPSSDLLDDEMSAFLKWFNADQDLDPVLKAGIAHLWFVTIHPFDDGNGRIARAIADTQLARSDNNSQRFYSMSAQIRKERNAYYDILKKTQQGDPDITHWLDWFLNCLDRALMSTDDILGAVIGKAKFWESHAAVSFNERQRIMLNKLLDGFEGKLNSSKWAKIAKCSSDTAARDINDLIQKKVLTKESAGGRSTSYVLTIENAQ